MSIERVWQPRAGDGTGPYSLSARSDPKIPPVMDFAQILLVIDKMVVTMFAITGALVTGRRVLPLEVRAATIPQPKRRK